MNWLTEMLSNPPFITGLTAWALAQFLKIPLEYLITGKWDWGLFFSTGGMPSSHSALMSSTTLAIGLSSGFGTPVFALAVAISMIVIYDAAGVRRQAGFHAQKINVLISELFQGQPFSEERLKEVLGHTPRQVWIGTILGIIVAFSIWGLW
jgi:uncharacterized protein